MESEQEVLATDRWVQVADGETKGDHMHSRATRPVIRPTLTGVVGGFDITMSGKRYASTMTADTDLFAGDQRIGWRAQLDMAAPPGPRNGP